MGDFLHFLLLCPTAPMLWLWFHPQTLGLDINVECECISHLFKLDVV